MMSSNFFKSMFEQILRFEIILFIFQIINYLLIFVDMNRPIWDLVCYSFHYDDSNLNCFSKTVNCVSVLQYAFY